MRCWDWLPLRHTMSHACSERFKLASEKVVREWERGQCSAFGMVNDAFSFCHSALCCKKSDLRPQTHWNVFKLVQVATARLSPSNKSRLYHLFIQLMGSLYSNFESTRRQEFLLLIHVHPAKWRLGVGGDDDEVPWRQSSVGNWVHWAWNGRDSPNHAPWKRPTGQKGHPIRWKI